MKRWIAENRGFLLFVFVLVLFRSAIADWNPIPSGSMRPTLLEGDVVLVNRLAYDVKVPFTQVSLIRMGDPQRGDIVTFYSPADGRRLIKRVVGLPGDKVAMTDKELIINGQKVSYVPNALVTEIIGDNHEVMALRLQEKLNGRSHEVQWLSGAHRAESFEEIEIPADQFLMLGDNRDNSADSRYIGLVHRDALIGKAQRVLVSAAIKEDWLPRIERFGQALD